MEITRIDGGMFVMDGQTYDLGTLLMVIGFERTENIENQIMEQAEQMNKRNKILEGLSNILATLNSASEDKVIDMNNYDTGIPKPDGSGNYSGKELWKEVGLPDLKSEEKFGGVDYCWGKEERQEAISLIKAKMDSLNSESQLDMIRLQGLMSKRDNIYQSISNLMKTDQKSKDNAVSNLR
ncbi:hypothetical protein [Desulfothermus sp.]